jgi:putative transposase
MEEHQSLSHTVWDCKYHVVFIPKCSRKTLYLELRKHLGRGIPQACGAEISKDRGRASDARPRHMMISIPPKYAVSQEPDARIAHVRVCGG